MNDTNHFNSVRLDAEEYFIREPAGENTTHVLVERLVVERVFCNATKRGIYFGKELVAKARLAFLVPVEGRGHVGLSFRLDDDMLLHFRREVMRARTVSQEEPA